MEKKYRLTAFFEKEVATILIDEDIIYKVLSAKRVVGADESGAIAGLNLEKAYKWFICEEEEKANEMAQV